MLTLSNSINADEEQKSYASHELDHNYQFSFDSPINI